METEVSHIKPFFKPPRKRVPRKSTTKPPCQIARVYSSEVVSTLQIDRLRLYDTTENGQPLTKSSSDKSIVRRSVPQSSSLTDEINIEVNPNFDSSDTLSSAKNKAKNLQFSDHINVDVELDDTTEHSALNEKDVGFVTFTGTIMRGKKASENVNVRVNLTREEIDANLPRKARITSQTKPRFRSCYTKGFHILLFTVLCSPFVFLVSFMYSFYIGTLAWYNVFLHFSEGSSILGKVIISPLLILAYPFIIPPMISVLGCYSGIIQISWSYDKWIIEVFDLEKGYFGWLCSFLSLEECSPYEVIILQEQSALEDCAKVAENGNVADTVL